MGKIDIFRNGSVTFRITFPQRFRNVAHGIQLVHAAEECILRDVE